jgi:glutathione S-transferase
MKLYGHDSGPGSRRVGIFLAEKGLSVPTEPFDPQIIDDRSGTLSGLDLIDRVPALELDDGTMVTGCAAICRYFEAMRPEPPLFGRGGKQQAVVEMWNRRIEGGLYRPACAFVQPVAGTQEFMDQAAEWGEKQRISEFLALLDRELHERLHIADDHFSVADITALVAVELIDRANLAHDRELRNVRRWHFQAAARPSARA